MMKEPPATTPTGNMNTRIEKRPNRNLAAQILTTLALAVLLQISLQTLTTQAEAFNDASSIQYDPENQDGIPVISSRSFNPTNKWTINADRFDNDDPAASLISQRRSSDNDLDDGLEEEDDDDRDEYKSGSSNHGSYENPAFGESRSAAKDAEDIEGFFDKHLGPPDARELSQDRDDTEASMSSGSPKSMEDSYEAAASSPLTTIFQSILNAHKRPLIIHTTEESSDDDSSKDSLGGPSASTQQDTSSSTLVGSSMRGSPPADASSVAYFTPITAPSSLSSYEQVGSSGGQGPSQADQDYPPVREIYISRRPLSYVNRYQAYTPSGQSSNAYWRGSSKPYDAPADFARYPVAASYAYGREQQAAPAAPEDSEQTMTFGLSFGRANDDSDSSSEPEEQTAADEQTYGPYAPARLPMRQTPSSSRAYNNYNYPPQVTASHGYIRMPAGAMMINQQAAYGGARYHRDPSEPIGHSQPVSHDQYSSGSGNVATSGNGMDPRWMARQKLLATLDRQIKSNPYYRQNSASVATSGTSNYAHLQSIGRYRGQASAKPAAYDDVDTYSSYHSEIDPYKSFTSSSRIVSEPMALDNNVQTGANQPNGRLQSAGMNGQQAQQMAGANDSGIRDTNTHMSQSGDHLTGPIINMDGSKGSLVHRDVGRIQGDHQAAQANLRVRRDDSDDREGDDADDDGVWVDDDEDDDNRQQSSDVNETSQEPEEGDDVSQQQDTQSSFYPSAMVGGNHGYELSPEDLVVYHG